MHHNVQVYISKQSNQVQYNVILFFLQALSKLPLFIFFITSFLGYKVQQHELLLPQIYNTILYRSLPPPTLTKCGLLVSVHQSSPLVQSSDYRRPLKP